MKSLVNRLESKKSLQQNEQDLAIVGDDIHLINQLNMVYLYAAKQTKKIYGRKKQIRV